MSNQTSKTSNTLLQRLRAGRTERRHTMIVRTFEDGKEELLDPLYLEAAAEIERLWAELSHARDEARAMHSAYESSVELHSKYRGTLERAGQRLTSLAKQARCRCQSTSGYTHHCEACRALKAAEDISVMLRGDVPARAADETKAEQS